MTALASETGALRAIKLLFCLREAKMQIRWGIAADDFRSSFLGREPFLFGSVLRSSEPGWSVAADALERHPVSPGLMKMVMGQRVPFEAFTAERKDLGVSVRKVILCKVEELIEHGATLILNRTELWTPAIRKLVDAVSEFSGVACAANLYAGAGEQRATRPHWDSHDVLAVQLAGRKFWRIFRPTFADPLHGQTSRYPSTQPEGEAVMEVELRAGDVLYVPRGWWHDVSPVSRHTTVHLAIGLHAPLVLDYIIWACGNLLSQDLAFRKALRSEVGNRALVREAVDKLSGLLLDESNFLQFEAAVLQKRSRRQVAEPFGRYKAETF